MTELAEIFRLPVKRLRALAQLGRSRADAPAADGAMSAGGDGELAKPSGQASVPPGQAERPADEAVGTAVLASTEVGSAG
jgi:hypothetical protein